MRLLGSTENDIAKYKNGGNVSKLKIIDAISMHCNVVSYVVTVINKHQKFYLRLYRTNNLCN